MDCDVPMCITNTNEDIIFWSPPIEFINDWSSLLGCQLTVNSCVCERHFRSEDIYYTKVFLDGSVIILKALASSAMPIPRSNTNVEE